TGMCRNPGNHRRRLCLRRATFHNARCDDCDDQVGTARDFFSTTPIRRRHMHFFLTGQYTPPALNALLENPPNARKEGAKKLSEGAGGRLVSMYSVAADGPGFLVFFAVPDPSAAPAISGLTVTAGTLHNVKLTRLFTHEEIKQVRQNAAKLRSSY